MCEKMTNIVESNQMLGPEQYGFRKGRSTSDAVFVLTSLLQKAKGKSWQYSAAFVDIAKVRFLQILIMSENTKYRHMTA